MYHLYADDVQLLVLANFDPSDELSIQSALTSLTLCIHYISLWMTSNSLKLKEVLHPWALFLKTLCIFSKNKATSDKVSYGSGQKCSKELKNHSFTSVETIVVKLQCKMCENQYFPCFEP